MGRRGRGTCQPSPSRSLVNPTSIRGNIMPTTQQLAPLRIFRPSYCPGMHCFVPTYTHSTLLFDHRPDGTYRVREDTLIYFCHYINPAYNTETKLVLVADYKLFPVVLKMFRWAFAIPRLFWFHPFGLETKNISRLFR